MKDVETPNLGVSDFIIWNTDFIVWNADFIIWNADYIIWNAFNLETPNLGVSTWKILMSDLSRTDEIPLIQTPVLLGVIPSNRSSYERHRGS